MLFSPPIETRCFPAYADAPSPSQGPSPGDRTTARARATGSAQQPQIDGFGMPANQERATNMENETQLDPTTESKPPEDRPEQPGAEGGSESPSADKLPGAPADDDSPLGDTDQHSDA